MTRTRLITALGILATLSGLVGLWRMRAARRTAASDANGPAAKKSALQHDDSFVALASLAEARTMEHTAVIMQGGDGERIYLTSPTKYVACDESALHELLTSLDELDVRRPGAASISFELAPIGSGVFGGTEGGSIVDGMWLSPRLEELGARKYAQDVLSGRSTLADVRADLRALAR